MSTRTDRRERIGSSNGSLDGTRDVGTGDHQLSKYDLFLAVLPLPLLFGLGWATLTGVSMSAGAGLGGVPSALLLAYGLFVGGPTSRQRRQRNRRTRGDVE